MSHIVVVVEFNVVVVFLHFLVQFGKLLFGLDVLIEVEDVAAQVHHHFNLFNQDLV